MLRRPQIRFLTSWILALATAFPPATAAPNHDKTVWNYEGGVFMETDGGIPGGACFRLRGKVSAEDFFLNFKRVDTNSGTFFRRGNDIVTEFPKQLRLSLMIFDMPCDLRLQQTGTRVYLTEEVIRSLRFSFFWKRGLDMRPASGVVARGGTIAPLPISTYGLDDHAPQRIECLLAFDVPSDGVPLTDSLVLVLRTSDHHVAARVAARL